MTSVILIIPPKANFYIVSNVNHTIVLNGSTSLALDGNITNCTWLFGDGTSLQSKNYLITNHTYKTAGYYNVSFTIQDNLGFINSFTHLVLINIPPIAIINNISHFNDTIILSAANSYDIDGYIHNYYWNFGDNRTMLTTTDVTHIYLLAGYYNITLNVTDNLRATDSQIIQNVFVNTPAVSDFMLLSIVNDSIILNGNNSYDVDGSIVTSVWNMGDGSSLISTQIPNINVSYTFELGGTYVISLIVTDNFGATGIKNQTIFVNKFLRLFL